jgi:hypothetical protein
LKEIADNTVLDEIWITDSKGHAYLRNNTEVDFSFSPDRERQPQAHVFWLQRQWLSLGGGNRLEIYHTPGHSGLQHIFTSWIAADAR